ncbi:glycosyl hydrolase 53 family protein [Jiangella aurantiaca]|uniref:glycosyl hydrolase 53 family protein n=1 Tax=Jiangella aurantiaca TaxID=2530373 RepID=UPI0013A5E2F2|nr:glycosyl hydrolase 53 family protein [Jiangella aurantiaca]
MTTTSAAETAELAVDDDPDTAWLSSRKLKQSLALDLGGAYDNIRKVEVVFPDAHGTYQYLVEVSSDGDTWNTVVDRSDADRPGRGEEHLVTAPGIAYLRVTITDASPGAAIGISELSVWNYLRDDLVLGADISYADQNTAQGLTYFVDDPTDAADILETVSDARMEYVRLRVFNDPRDERTGAYLDPDYQSPERTLAVADRVVRNGMGLGIDFHFADSWADPSKQAKPTAWRELPFDKLTRAVYDYTYENVENLVEQGTTPDKVAIGNELINGFMWGGERTQPWFDASAWCGSCYFNTDPSFVSQPGGGILWDYWRSDDAAEQAAYDAAWDRFTTLQAAGIAAVRDVSAAYGADIAVETHVIIDNGRVDKTLEFWDQYLTRLNAKGQDIDVMAHSYYPEWHGTADHFEANLQAVAAAHPGYALEIAETSHPANDYDGRPVPNSPYPKSPVGAAEAIQRVVQIANDLPDNRGVGVLVWEPANYQEMIDWDDSAWPAVKFHDTIKIYGDSDATHVLEDTVHRSIRFKDPLRLPDTVEVLSMADGSVAPVPVAWEDVPSSATSTPGQLVVNGTTTYGPVTAVVDVVRRPLVPVVGR